MLMIDFDQLLGEVELVERDGVSLKANALVPRRESLHGVESE